MWLYAIVAVVAAAGAWQVQDWRYGAADAARMAAADKAHKVREKSIDTAAVGHEKDKRELRTEFLVITERVDHVLQTDFYAAGQPGCLDDAGLRELNAARGPAAPAASEPARAVPGLAPAQWWKPSRQPEKPG